MKIGCLILAALLAASPAVARDFRVNIPVWVEGVSSSENSQGIQFEATVNGRPAAIAAQRGPASDQLILIVADLTGDLSLIEAAKEAVVAQLGKLPANTWVGVMRAQDGLRVLADPDASRQAATAAVQSLSATGKAALLDTVEQVISIADAIGRKTSVRTCVLYVTDSSIYNYREDYSNPVINQSDPHDLSRRFPGMMVREKVSRLGERLSTLQAPLFVVQLSDRKDSLNQAYQNGLIGLGAATGGKTEVCRTIGEIPDAIATAFARAAGTWNIVLALPEKSGATLQVRLSARRGKEELRVTWRTRISLTKE